MDYHEAKAAQARVRELEEEIALLSIEFDQSSTHHAAALVQNRRSERQTLIGALRGAVKVVAQSEFLA